MQAALAAAGLDPQGLVLEITETAIMEQLDAVITILTELRRLAARLALDDFGTDYSSLSYLQRLPVDILETAEQLAALRELGCQLGQGYYFARPSAPQPLTPCSNATTPERMRPPHRPRSQCPDVRNSLPTAQPGIHAIR